jgi:hypothetical protein
VINKGCLKLYQTSNARQLLLGLIQNGGIRHVLLEPIAIFTQYPIEPDYNLGAEPYYES